MEKKYDVFISYSRKDYLMDDGKTPDPDKIVSKILNLLDTHKISYWIDKESLYSSAQFTAVIEEQISAARCFLFISTHASNASKYTLGEVFTAVEYEKPIIPFRADDSKFGKGIGFHLRPLDHIEYFKTGEEAFVKLISSINYIKADQLHDQLIAEYQDIITEYKLKITTKSNEMKSLGINPPVDYLIDGDASSRMKIEYEQRIASHLDEIKRLNNQLSEKQLEVVSLKQSLSDTTDTLDRIKRELQAYKDADAKQKVAEAELKAREAEARSKAEEEKMCGLIKVGNIEFKMIHVEGGTFTMGEGRDAHQVTLSAYHIGETPVTQALWKEIMGNNPSKFKGESKPVESVSWNDCQEFIKKLNKRTNKRFRLLTEAEWEYAARGGKKSKGYEYAGSNSINDVAWYEKNSDDKGLLSPDYGTHPVKSKKSNELGIYDMSGNVWEWCQDWYGNYNKEAQTNPTGLSSGSNRVCRGGSWFNDANRCRLSFRYCFTPGNRGNGRGFRLALSE